MIFEEVVTNVLSYSSASWLYLPRGEKWTLKSNAAVLESDEVLPEDEDLPDAGIPVFAKTNNLVQVMPITTLNSIITNAGMQDKHSIADIFTAFEYYYINDSYLDFSH